MMRKVPIALLVAALLIAIPGVLRLLGNDGTSSREVVLQPSSTDTGVLGTAQRVAFWRGRVQGDEDYLNRVQLSAALLESARQTGDLASYAEANDVVDAALVANPSSLDAQAINASVLFGIHEFEAAYETADSVLVKDPDSLQALSVAGDALLELGRYAEASEIYDRLYAAQQGPAVLVRQARLAWHRGDATSAVEFSEQALRRANETGLPPADLAFFALQLATYRFDTGDVDGSHALARAAVEIAPELPAAQATLGRALAAQGDVAGATDRYRRATAAIPSPEYLAALGDVLFVAGDTAGAELQYETVAVVAALANIGDGLYDRAMARFWSDHDVRLDEALAMARQEFEIRKDVYAYDTLAWALHKSGQDGEAGEIAGVLATFDPVDPLVLYHLGMIASTSGETEQATEFLERALAINEAFHPLEAPRARDELAALRGAS